MMPSRVSGDCLEWMGFGCGAILRMCDVEDARVSCILALRVRLSLLFGGALWYLISCASRLSSRLWGLPASLSLCFEPNWQVGALLLRWCSASSPVVSLSGPTCIVDCLLLLRLGWSLCLRLVVLALLLIFGLDFRTLRRWCFLVLTGFCSFACIVGCLLLGRLDFSCLRLGCTGFAFRFRFGFSHPSLSVLLLDFTGFCELSCLVALLLGLWVVILRGLSL